VLQRRNTGEIFLDERAAHREFDGGHSRADAERLAFGEMILEWHRRYGARADPHRGAGCGDDLPTKDGLALCDGARVHFDAVRKVDCIITYGKKWRSAAVAALRELGFNPAAGLRAVVVADGALLGYVAAPKFQRQPLGCPVVFGDGESNSLRRVVVHRLSAPTLAAVIADVKNPSGLRCLICDFFPPIWVTSSGEYRRNARSVTNDDFRRDRTGTSGRFHSG
jgi:hypothetical protein